jgi:hypothetical protein
MKPLPVLEPGMTAEAQADFVSRCERLRHQGGLRNEAQARAGPSAAHQGAMDRGLTSSNAIAIDLNTRGIMTPISGQRRETNCLMVV